MHEVASFTPRPLKVELGYLMVIDAKGFRVRPHGVGAVAVAAFFGVTPAHLHSTKKDKTVSLARHYSMYLARKHTNLSSSEVGRLMGNKNHATVLVACKRIEDLVERNAELHWRGPAGNKIARAKATLTKLEGSISK